MSTLPNIIYNMACHATMSVEALVSLSHQKKHERAWQFFFWYANDEGLY